MLDGGGRILLLGSDHDHVTFLHHAEHTVDVPDKRIVRFQVPVLEQGLSSLATSRPSSPPP
jgi:aminoglycoside 3-N-acetyltransferase